MLDEIQVLYRDEWLAAVYKPANMLVHRSRISNDKTSLLKILRHQLRQRVYPVHRLDRPSCGVMLFALSRETLSLLNRDFQSQAIKKQYLAVVRGWVKDNENLDYPLKCFNKDKHQQAVTHYQCLAKTELPIPVRPYITSRYSLVLVKPLTGRRHQIRRHFAHIRHPVIGDVNHGDGKHNLMFREQFNCRRLLLMAFALSFTHPHQQRPLTIITEPDPVFSQTLKRVFPDPDTVIASFKNRL